MMPSHVRSAAPGRRLVGLLAVVVSVALVVVDSGYAPAAQLSGPAVGEDADGRSNERQGGGQGVAAESAPPPAAGVPGTDPDAVNAAVEPGGIHVVQPGETFGGIAERYGVSTRAVARANRHQRADALRPGVRIVVPDPQAPRPLTPEQAMAAGLEVERLLTETAQRYGWNPATVKAVAWYESRWNHQLISDQGAIGVMQVQPATGELMGRRVGRPLDLHDLADNIEAGVAYLDHLHGVYRGDLRSIVAAYHQGPQAVSDRGIYATSNRYADEVIRLRDRFRR
jgi:LysM repeat protein